MSCKSPLGAIRRINKAHTTLVIFSAFKILVANFDIVGICRPANCFKRDQSCFSGCRRISRQVSASKFISNSHKITTIYGSIPYVIRIRCKLRILIFLRESGHIIGTGSKICNIIDQGIACSGRNTRLLQRYRSLSDSGTAFRSCRIDRQRGLAGSTRVGRGRNLDRAGHLTRGNRETFALNLCIHLVAAGIGYRKGNILRIALGCKRRRSGRNRNSRRRGVLRGRLHRRQGPRTCHPDRKQT